MPSTQLPQTGLSDGPFQCIGKLPGRLMCRLQKAAGPVRWAGLAGPLRGSWLAGTVKVGQWMQPGARLGGIPFKIGTHLHPPPPNCPSSPRLLLVPALQLHDILIPVPSTASDGGHLAKAPRLHTIVTQAGARQLPPLRA